MQDNFSAAIEPTDSLTFAQYGVTDFTVQSWNGSAWVTLATVTGNNLVKRAVSFAATTTDRIRVNITNALGSYSRITEIEVYGAAVAGPQPTSTALASSLNPSASGAGVTFTATVTGSSPTGTVAFTDNGSSIAGCSAVALPAGTAASKAATCTTAALTAATHSIVATYGGNAGNAGSTSAALSQVVNSGTGVNVALATNGGVASASSTYTATGYNFAAANVNNGDRAGLTWGAGGGWNDATSAAFPDWIQVNFSGAKTIDHIVLYTLQDNYAAPVQPTDTMTFTLYGVTDFTVQSWNGSAWVTLATVTGNNLVKRTVSFAATTTDRVRVNITNALGSYSRVVELEAWTSGVAQSNMALAANGGVATASSTYTLTGYDFTAATVINGDRAGLNWGHGGGWNDATSAAFPDWIQVNFSGAKTIDHIVLYTLQDNYAAPVQPTDTMTFTLYGVTDFTVQSWNGSAWVTLATVTGNNLVKRTVNFTATTTDRVRVNITNALASYSRIIEIEAWGI